MTLHVQWLLLRDPLHQWWIPSCVLLVELERARHTSETLETHLPKSSRQYCEDIVLFQYSSYYL